MATSEQPRDVHAEAAPPDDEDAAPDALLDEALLDVGVGARGHLVLEPLELGAELFGQKVRHDRDQLTDLDEQPLEPRDRAMDATRVA